MILKTKRTLLCAAIIASSSSANALTINLENGKTLDIYGYAKLDLIYDVDDKMGPTVNYGAISVDPENTADGFTDLHTYETRLGFKTTIPTSMGDIETVVEGEFYGNGGGDWLLNHAYVKTDHILAGQTWSNFSNFISKTPTIDFLGGVGQTVLDQQPQLRYINGGFSAALEKPGNLGGRSKVYYDTNIGSVPDYLQNKNSLPDLTFQYQNYSDHYSYGISAVVRDVEIYNANTSSEERTLGYGFGLSGKASVSDVLSIQGGYVAGDGIGGYLYGSPAPVGFYDPNKNEATTIEAYGATLGVTYSGLPLGQLNVAYGMVETDLDNAKTAGLEVSQEIERIQSIYVNYLWQGDYGIQYGIEVGNHRKELVDGRDGDATRVQAMVKYGF